MSNFKEGGYILNITADHIKAAGTDFKSWERNPVANAFRDILPCTYVGSDLNVTVGAWYHGDAMLAIYCAHPAELYPWFEAWEKGESVQPTSFAVNVLRNHGAEAYERRMKASVAKTHAMILDLAEREHRHWTI